MEDFLGTLELERSERGQLDMANATLLRENASLTVRPAFLNILTDRDKASVFREPCSKGTAKKETDG